MTTCVCGKPGIVSRERLHEGAWVCLDHATKDAERDAERRPLILTGFKMSDYFLKKHGPFKVQVA